MTRERISVVVYRHIAFEDLGTWDSVLRDMGCDITVVDVGTEQWDNYDYCAEDLAIILGGPIGVDDRELYPFLDPQIAGIAARLEAKKPTIGVCLGAQMMAVAAGADLQPGGGANGGVAGALEIGFSPLTLTSVAQGTALEELDNTEVLHWHGDCFSVPEDALGGASLAFTPNYPNQAFILEEQGIHYGLAVQFHPEFDYRFGERWLIGHTSDLRAQNIDIPALRQDMVTKGKELEAASTVMLKRWLRDSGVLTNRSV